MSSAIHLTIGQKYLLDIAPWGLHPVRYLGPSKWLKTYSRVQNPITFKVYSIRTEKLRPLLVDVTP